MSENTAAIDNDLAPEVTTVVVADRPESVEGEQSEIHEDIDTAKDADAALESLVAGLESQTIGGKLAATTFNVIARQLGQPTVSTESIDLNDLLKRSQTLKRGVGVALEQLYASLEAAGLKSGSRVKFSHGHGKVTKVLTAPFKAAGKVHHASKDKPLYLVTADKGGHKSVHKASALTLV